MIPMVDRKSHPSTNSSMTPGSTSNARSACLFPSPICTSTCSVTPLDRPSANRTCLCVAPSSNPSLTNVTANSSLTKLLVAPVSIVAE
ncbi:hypothetical protein ACLKA6_017502 [Drosophila palustris]